MQRWAIVGTGSRHRLFRLAISELFADRAQLAGLCDVNAGRLAQAAASHEHRTGAQVATWAAADFDSMLREASPDVVVVTTVDATHHDYICRALRAGCNVVTEKPLTTRPEYAREIQAAVAESGREVRVCHNYRYSPVRARVKELLADGTIGTIESVDFHWLLDTRHGADYFRRWHRNKANSGGLLVHKATHHFDLANWWIGDVPSSVFATGERRFYTPATAASLGLDGHGPRCHTCSAADRCSFALRLTDYPPLEAMYLDHEAHDGYHRDQCVFDASIDIEDSMALAVTYRGGVRLSYSLNAFMPWEGYTIAFNGSRGRLEHKMEESVYVSGDGSVPGALKAEGSWIRVYPQDAPAYEVPLPEASGGHGGADPLLMQDVFAPDGSPDPLHRRATVVDGTWSVIPGFAANDSIASGSAVSCANLVPGLGLPDYALQ